MSDQIWATTVADVRTSAPFEKPSSYVSMEHREAILSGSLGQKLDPRKLAPHYTLLDHLVPKDVSALPPVLSLSHRFVTEEFKAIIEQFDIGKTYFHKTALLDRSDPPIELGTYWAIVVQEAYETVDRDAGIREGWLKPHPNFPDKNARYRPESHELMQVKITSHAAPSVDLWSDNYLIGMLFFSDRLKRALDKLPGAEHFHLRPVGPAVNGGGAMI